MIKKTLLISAFIMAIFASPSLVSSQDSTDDLAIEVFVSDNKEWLDKSYLKVALDRRIHRAKINQLLHAGFIVSGYSSTEEQVCNFQVSIKLIDPNGKTVFEVANFAEHRQKVSGKEDIIGNKIVDLMLENSDPIGTYKIEASVIDNLSFKKASSEYLLEIE